jgi:hypothetical protein
MEIIISIASIIAFVGGIIIGLSIKTNIKQNIHDDACCIYNYDVILKCNKLFVTTHYKAVQDYNIIDLSEYLKQGIIRIDCGRARPAEPGEAHGRTYFYGPALVRKKKGNDLWDWMEL